MFGKVTCSNRLTNIVDTDQTIHVMVQSDLVLHCLSEYFRYHKYSYLLYKMNKHNYVASKIQFTLKPYSLPVSWGGI